MKLTILAQAGSAHWTSEHPCHLAPFFLRDHRWSQASSQTPQAFGMSPLSNSNSPTPRAHNPSPQAAAEKKPQSQMSQGHTSICRLSCNIIYDTNPSYFMACSCLSLMDFQLYLGSFSISTPSPAWIAAARGKARGFAGEARSLLASEKNLLITPPKTIKNAQGFAGMVDPRTRPVISRFPYVYIYMCVCVWELVKVGICLLQMLAQFKFDYR